MTPETLTIVVAILGFIVALLLVLVFALARQIGLLHTRLAPAGALLNSAGAEVGAEAPKLALQDIRGRPVQIGGPGPGPTLVLFVSPNCPVCKELVPVARSMARADKLRLIFASDGQNADAHLAYIERMGLADYPYLVSAELGMQLGADKLPYAALIDGSGILSSRGLVNSREHLESLLEAKETGYGSIQDYLDAHSTGRAPARPNGAAEGEHAGAGTQ